MQEPLNPRASGLAGTLSWSGVWYASHLAKMLLPVFLPAVTTEFSAGDDEAALVLTGFIACTISSKLVAGQLADRLPCKTLVLAATLGAALCLASASRMTSLGGLGLCWCALGLCDGLQFSTGLAFLGRSAQAGRYGRTHGLRLAATAAGTASAPLLVALTDLEWRTTFLLTAAIVLVAAIAFQRGVDAEPTPERRARAGPEDGRRLRLPAVLAGLIALQCVLALAGQSVTSFTQQFFVTERGFDMRDSAALLTILTGVGILGPPLWGTLADRFGRRPALSAALVVHAGGILSVSYLPAGMPLVASFAALGLVRTAVYPVTYALVSERFTASQGRIFGLAAALGHGAGALGLLTVGCLAERHGFQVVFPLLAAVPLAGLIFVRYLR